MKSILIAESIPYSNARDKFNKMKKELNKNRTIEVFEDEKVIYSARKRRCKKR